MDVDEALSKFRPFSHWIQEHGHLKVAFAHTVNSKIFARVFIFEKLCMCEVSG